MKGLSDVVGHGSFHAICPGVCIRREARMPYGTEYAAIPMASGVAIGMVNDRAKDMANHLANHGMVPRAELRVNT